jgi:hypothetical protein
MNHGIAVEVIQGGHEAILELLFGCDTLIGSNLIRAHITDGQEAEARKLGFCVIGEIDTTMLHRKPRSARSRVCYNITLIPTPRRFRPPWKIEEHMESLNRLRRE